LYAFIPTAKRPLGFLLRVIKIIKSAHSTIPKKPKKAITQMELLTLNENPKKYSNVNPKKIQKIEGWLVSE
jgi:hypothetical protein